MVDNEINSHETNYLEPYRHDRTDRAGDVVSLSKITLFVNGDLTWKSKI